TLDPELKQARGLLASIYHEQGYADLEVEQFQRLLEQIRATGPDPRMSEADFNKQVDDLEREIDRKEKDLDQRRRDYELRAQNKSPSQKVDLAMKNGLGQQALDVLLEADPTSLRRAEVQAKLNLLLITGRVAEAADPAVRQTDFDSILVDAVLGAYGEADEALDRLIRDSQQQSAAQMLGLDRALALQAAMNPGGLARVTDGVARQVRSQANMMVFRGLLALEQGDTAAATRYFQTVVDLAGPRTGGGKRSVDVPSEFDFENRAIAVHYLDLLRAAGN
ncbi:MAG TPA: hypothetical protein VG013_25645, partial [Gemmataceae bacterium]|nr:hypothetical protein [Gemmataceae bacterium]